MALLSWFGYRAEGVIHCTKLHFYLCRDSTDVLQYGAVAFTSLGMYLGRKVAAYIFSLIVFCLFILVPCMYE
jgi:hypothetical protein